MEKYGLEEATWETAERMRKDYPQLFNDPGNLNFEDKIFIRRGELSHPYPKTLITIHPCMQCTIHNCHFISMHAIIYHLETLDSPRLSFVNIELKTLIRNAPDRLCVSCI